MLMATIEYHSRLNYRKLFSLIGLVLVYIDLFLALTKLLSNYPIIIPTDIIGNYTRSELLQLQDNDLSHARLPKAIWGTVLSLGIEREDFQPTRRGCRAGLKVKQKHENSTYHTNVTSISAQSVFTVI